MNHCPQRFRVVCLIAVNLAAGCAVAVDDARDVDDSAGLDEVPLSRCRGPGETDDPGAGLERIQPVYPSSARGPSETDDPHPALERAQPVYASGVDDCVSSARARTSASSKAVPTVVNASARSP